MNLERRRKEKRPNTAEGRGLQRGHSGDSHAPPSCGNADARGGVSRPGQPKLLQGASLLLHPSPPAECRCRSAVALTVAAPPAALLHERDVHREPPLLARGPRVPLNQGPGLPRLCGTQGLSQIHQAGSRSPSLRRLAAKGLMSFVPCSVGRAAADRARSGGGGRDPRCD